MPLSTQEIDRALQQGPAAFPRFSHWTHVNEEDDEHLGFAMWGEYAPPGDDEARFFITLDNFEDRWRGHLTVGQHFYMWSSADFGDACLLDTVPCASLAEAIAALQSRIRDLFEALSPA